MAKSILHSLELENFKAFGKNTKVPFAPITLIFGQNSAGKSSILQALYLLKESVNSGTVDINSTNGISDLGSYKSMVFNHEVEKEIGLKLLINDNPVLTAMNHNKPYHEELETFEHFRAKSRVCGYKHRLHLNRERIVQKAISGFLLDPHNALLEISIDEQSRVISKYCETNFHKWRVLIFSPARHH